MSVSFYTYLCIYVCLYLQLPLDDINSVALEWIVRGTLVELTRIFFISLSLRNKIFLSKLEAVVCESYGLLFAWSPLGHYLVELLVKKWYKAHILLGKLLRQCLCHDWTRQLSVSNNSIRVWNKSTLLLKFCFCMYGIKKITFWGKWLS